MASKGTLFILTNLMPEFWVMMRNQGMSFILITIMCGIFGTLYYNSVQDTIQFRVETKKEFLELYKSHNQCNAKIIQLLETTIKENTKISREVLHLLEEMGEEAQK